MQTSIVKECKIHIQLITANAALNCFYRDTYTLHIHTIAYKLLTAVCKQFAFSSGIINHILHSIASGSGKRLAKCSHVDHVNRSHSCSGCSGCGSNNVDTNTRNYRSPCAELHLRCLQLSSTSTRLLSSIAFIALIAFIRSYFFHLKAV